MKLVLVTIALATIYCVNGLEQPDEGGIKKENANDFLDTALKLIRKKYKEPMNPIKIKDRSIGLNQRMGLLPMSLLVHIQNGNINKIGKIKRVGDAFMTVIPATNDDDDDSTVTDAVISLDDIRFNATIEIEVFAVRHWEIVQGRVGEVQAQFQMSTNGTTGERSMTGFKIIDMRDIDLNLRGPYQIISRISSIPLRIGTRFVMNSNLKKIVNTIVTVAAADTVSHMVTERSESLE